MSEDVRPFEEYKEMIKDMRKEEMIKGLYDLSKNITEKDKKIERLNDENKMLKEAVKEKVIATCNTCEDYGICPHSYREYDLNNIINELEKYLIEEIEHYEKQIKYYKNNKDLRSGILDLVGEYEGEKVCFEDMLGKLQELKGGEKE